MVQITTQQNLEILSVVSVFLLLLLFIVLNLCCRIKCELRNNFSQLSRNQQQQDNQGDLSDYSPPSLPPTPPGQGAERYV
tara:strand:- start:50 stop:289 length:240 start_codon:yes stop_codon:yes gene_type:complete